MVIAFNPVVSLDLKLGNKVGSLTLFVQFELVEISTSIGTVRCKCDTCSLLQSRSLFKNAYGYLSVIDYIRVFGVRNLQ